ncbi:hypothetical protein H4R18_002086 [Coemansia javaensis]|uniref:Mitotic-spindle organizing protein 1 n=1 Tax=Coemansia javaensis TaxID=2761396 RepID=A0A9W8LKK5_9FUNG|nr:hypothetical protein H4R18_002086 [Coemansia javaensis]
MSSYAHDTDPLEVLRQLAAEVGAGLTKPQIAVALRLLRQGVNPTALVAITQELRREARAAADQPADRRTPQH